MAQKKERNCGASTCNQRLGALKSFFRYLQFALPDCALQCQEKFSHTANEATRTGLKYLTIDGIKLLLEQPDIKPNTVAVIWPFLSYVRHWRQSSRNCRY